MIYAFVLAEDGTRLMPTDIRHARRLLKKKEAVIVEHKPFTIRLTRPSEHHVQPIEFCCDTGSEHIGVSIKSEKHEFVHNQYDNFKDEKKRHANRLKMRRARRGRKRYHKARFDNRKKDKGWIAPSLENKEQNHLRIAAKYNKICPIIQATIEVGSFDTAAMKEYEETGNVLEGKDYQHGPRYGYATLREAVFYRDGYKCCCCKKGIKKGAILRIHHLGYRNGDRSNRIGNLITVCTECHTAANHKPGGKLYDWKPKVKPLKDAAFMNVVRWKLYNDIKEMFPEWKMTGDIVVADVPHQNKRPYKYEGHYVGRVMTRATGSFDIRTLGGDKVTARHDFCRIIQYVDGYQYSLCRTTEKTCQGAK